MFEELAEHARGATREELRALTGLELAMVDAAAEELVAARMIIPLGPGTFVVPLVRQRADAKRRGSTSRACRRSILLRDAQEPEGLGRWLRAKGWTVRAEATNARNPYALRRTREEEDLALSLTLAYSRWATISLGSSLSNQ